MKESNSMEEKLNKLSRAVKPDQVFSERLWHEIENSKQKEKRPKIIALFVKKPAMGFAGLLVAAMMIFTAIQPQMVLAAFRGLFDYLPGIGFIEDAGTAKSIAEPIILTRDGVTVNVHHAVADVNKTVISYDLEPDAAIAEGFNECFYSTNKLELSDGRMLLPIGGGVSNHSARIEYMALPEGETTPILNISRDDWGENCGGPLAISVEIPFTVNISAEELSTVFDSNEISINSHEGASTIDSGFTQGDVENPSLILFQIDHLVDLENEQTIFGHIEWDNPQIENVLVDYESIHVMDGEGNNVPVMPSSEQHADSAFSFVIEKNDWINPLTLVVDKVQISYRPENSLDFMIDKSSIEEIGQSMDMDQQFELAGKTFRCEKVTYIQFDRSEHTGYTFDFQIDPDIHSIELGVGEDYGVRAYFSSVMHIDAEHIQVSIGSTQSFIENEIPFTIERLTYLENGHWEMQWNMPE